MMQKMKDIGLIDAPIVTIFHGYDITNYLERVRGDFYDNLFSRGDLFLPISDRWRRRLKDLGCPADRTRLQRLGTDLDTFVPVDGVLAVGVARAEKLLAQLKR